MPPLPFVDGGGRGGRRCRARGTPRSGGSHRLDHAAGGRDGRIDPCVVDAEVRDHPHPLRAGPRCTARPRRRGARGTRSRPARQRSRRRRCWFRRRRPPASRPAARPARRRGAPRARGLRPGARRGVRGRGARRRRSRRAWRIPPPSWRRNTRARAIISRGPVSTEPTGAPRPLEKQNDTLSASAAIVAASVSSASAALKMRAPSRCTAARRGARPRMYRACCRGGSRRRYSGCACSRGRPARSAAPRRVRGSADAARRGRCRLGRRWRRCAG